VGGGVAAWIAWAVLLGWLLLLARAPDGLGTEVYFGGALVALGLVPALVVAHIASRRTRDSVRVDVRGVFAHATLLLDFDRPLDACVVELPGETALLARQGNNWLVLFGSSITHSLGGREAWGGRWHQASVEHLRHRAIDTEPGSAWPSCFTIRGPGDASVIGDVEPSEQLRHLARRLREAAEITGGALLALPTLHPHFHAVRVTAAGKLEAFGSSIDVAAPYSLQRFWALGRENARGDTDAVLLEQDESAILLSVSVRPGGWPAPGALPSAAPEQLSPELPAEEVLSPAALAVLDGFLCRRARHTVVTAS
jgi:hypothetical protein